MLRIQFDPPPLDERVVNGFSDDIDEVRFETQLMPVNCVVSLKPGADIQRVTKQITDRCVFGMKPKVEFLDVYQEQPESDDSDEPENEEYNQDPHPTPQQDEIDAESFVTLIRMHIRGKLAMKNSDPIAVIDLTDDYLSSDGKDDVDAASFIQDVLQVSNKNTQSVQLEDGAATSAEEPDSGEKETTSRNNTKRTIANEQNVPQKRINSCNDNVRIENENSVVISDDEAVVESSSTSRIAEDDMCVDRNKTIESTDLPLKYPCEINMKKMFDL